MLDEAFEFHLMSLRLMFPKTDKILFSPLMVDSEDLPKTE